MRISECIEEVVYFLLDCEVVVACDCNDYCVTLEVDRIVVRCVCAGDVVVVSAVDEDVSCVCSYFVAADAGEVLVVEKSVVVSVVEVEESLSCCLVYALCVAVLVFLVRSSIDVDDNFEISAVACE